MMMGTENLYGTLFRMKTIQGCFGIWFARKNKLSWKTGRTSITYEFRVSKNSTWESIIENWELIKIKEYNATSLK